RFFAFPDVVGKTCQRRMLLADENFAPSVIKPGRIMRELTYIVAVSLDGFIAGPNGEFDAFASQGAHAAPIWDRYRGTAPTQLAQAAGLPIDGCPFDTVLMGWNTYAVGLPALPNPYAHLQQVVFTSEHHGPSGSQDVQFTNADPRGV